MVELPTPIAAPKAGGWSSEWGLSCELPFSVETATTTSSSRADHFRKRFTSASSTAALALSLSLPLSLFPALIFLHLLFCQLKIRLDFLLQFFCWCRHPLLQSCNSFRLESIVYSSVNISCCSLVIYPDPNSTARPLVTQSDFSFADGQKTSITETSVRGLEYRSLCQSLR